MTKRGRASCAEGVALALCCVHPLSTWLPCIMHMHAGSRSQQTKRAGCWSLARPGAHCCISLCMQRTYTVRVFNLLPCITKHKINVFKSCSTSGGLASQLPIYTTPESCPASDGHGSHAFSYTYGTYTVVYKNTRTTELAWLPRSAQGQQQDNRRVRVPERERTGYSAS